MPIYEYACKACGHTFDVLQKMSDAPLTDCPACGAAELRKLISAPSFRLKGSGWYETDFKQDKQRNLHGDKEDKPKSSGDKDKAKTGGKNGKSDKQDTAGKASGDKSSSGDVKPTPAKPKKDKSSKPQAE